MLITKDTSSARPGIILPAADPLTQFYHQVIKRPKFKRLAICIKANGISLVLYANKRVTSAFGQSIELAIEKLSQKISI